MAHLLKELQWSKEPLVPRSHDPAWEAEIRAVMGMVPDSLMRVAPSKWVRRSYFDAMRTTLRSLSDAEAELAGLVTSQENACRYCYGVARTRMLMMGFTEEMVDRIERRAQLAEADDRERELVRFCRDLARSKPRPAKKARDTMASVGFTPLQTAELAVVVAFTGFCNRVATLVAAEPELEMEKMGRESKNLWSKLSAWLPGKTRGPQVPPPDYPAPTFDVPYGNLVRLLDGSPAAATFEVILRNAFSSELLPHRTLALMFAIVARTLDCKICESVATRLLDADGVGRDVQREVLDTLSSPAVTDLEALVVPWARDTVWMPEQPARIQERSRPILEAVGPAMYVEIVGGAALANACARLAMLET